MKVSIIIPTLNCAQYLPRCIESVKAQTYKDWECIIVDDGSTDRSADVLEEITGDDARFRVFWPGHQGLPGARNTGMDYARGDAYFFLDADDWIEPECIEYLVGQAVEHPEAGRIVGPCLTHWWLDNPRIARHVPWAIEPTGIHPPDSVHLFSGNSCDVGHCTGSLYVLNRLDKRVMHFPVKVFRFEDMIFNMGVIFSGVTTLITDRYLYDYRRRVGSITLNPGYTEQNVADAREALAMLAYRFPPQKKTYERCKAFLENRLEQTLKTGN